MQHLIKALYESLQSELLLYSSLKDLIRQEQRLVEGFETEAMFSAVEEKESLVNRIRQSEAKRALLVKQIAEAIGCPAERVNVTLLLDHLNPAQANLLDDVRNRLQQAIGEMAMEARKLEARIQTSVSIYEDTMTYMYQQLSGRQSKTYPGMPAKSRRSNTQSVVVSQHV